MTTTRNHDWMGTIDLPDHFRATAEERSAIAALVASRVPFPIDIEWKLSRSPFKAVLRPAPSFPELVPFADLKAEMDACKAGEIVIGLTARRELYKGSFLTDDPHWGFSVGSRRGKSTFLSLTLAQILHQDARATATGIDVKRESFKSLVGVPGFRLANNPRDIAEMWAMIKDVRVEMDARCDARSDDLTLEFPFQLLAIDEANQFSAMSQQWWRRTKKKADPACPPVWEDVAAIFWQGAAFHCHVVLAGQSLYDRVTGGIGLNASLGLRGLAGFWPRDWQRLLGTPPQRSRSERGRWIYADGDSETWVQNVMATDQEIRDYALTLRRPAPLHDPVVQGETAADVPDWVVGNDAAALRTGLLTDTFRRRRRKTPVPGEGRRGNQPMWRGTDLDTWAAGEHSGSVAR